MLRIYFYLLAFICLTFNANAQTVTLISPNGGEILPGASQKDIEWTSFNVDNIKIEFSHDNGSTWNTVVASYPTSALKYSWTIPIQQSNNCLIKISDILDPAVFDVSNSTFTIPPSEITLLSPDGGENLTRGELKVISWNSTSVDYLDIEYSVDNGSTWTMIKSSHPALLGNYNWPVPSSASSLALIRLTMSSNSSVSDVSNGVFTIVVPPAENINHAKYHGGSYDGYSMATNVSPVLTLLAPDGGEILNGGSTYYINWTASNLTHIKIEYSDNNGGNWSAIESSISAFPNTYPWNVPLITSSQCLIKITDLDNPSVTDQSAGVFSIIPSLIDLTYPAGGETVYTGSLLPIMWTSTGIANIKIEYSPDNGINWIVSQNSYPASRKIYNWIAPTDLSTEVLFRISDASAPSTSDASIVPVSIIALPVSDVSKYHGGSYDGYSMADNAPPTLNLLTPDGGQSLNGNSSYSITWTSSGVNNIKIEFSTDNGVNWAIIESNISAYPNSYTWTVPSVSSTQCFIRITDLQDNTLTDQSSSSFEILTPQILISYPTGGQSVYVGSQIPVIWTSVSVTNVKIEYSLDGSSWNVLQASYPSSNRVYNVVVPDAESSQVVLRLTDASNPSVGDTSETFSIVESQVPDVRKYHGGSFDGHAMSNNIVTILSPNGSETLSAGSTHTISWVINENTNILSLYTVKIEYSVNGGSTWNIIESSYDTDVSEYEWSIPNTPSSQCKIRVTSLSLGNEEDVSDNFFEITSATSIQNPLKDEIRILPNPSSGELYVDIGGQEINNIQIVNLLGEMVYFQNANLSESFYLNLEYLPEGIYVLKGDLKNGQSIFFRFIIGK